MISLAHQLAGFAQYGATLNPGKLGPGLLRTNRTGHGLLDNGIGGFVDCRNDLAGIGVGHFNHSTGAVFDVLPVDEVTGLGLGGNRVSHAVSLFALESTRILLSHSPRST